MSIENAEVRKVPAWKRNEPVQLRTVPFGPPKERDNTRWNPGRQRYLANNGHSYFSLEGRNLYWLNQGRKLGKKTVWQSGPTMNNVTNDQYVDGCGFWTVPGGTNCDWENFIGAGNPHKMAGMTIKPNEEDAPYMFDFGHATAVSGETEASEYGAVGFSGWMVPDRDDGYADYFWNQGGNDSLASIGLRHAYMMYRSDATDGELSNIKDTLSGILDIASSTSDFLIESIPEEVQATYKGGSLEGMVDETDLLEKFLSKDLFQKFNDRKFKNEGGFSGVVQLLAEIILNKKGKSVADYAHIINELVDRSKEEEIDGIDIFDFMVRLAVAEDTFFQENAELFSLRNLFNDLYDVNIEDIQESDKTAVLGCFLSDGVVSKDEETGEWRCRYLDDTEPLELLGRTQPYGSSENFQSWCDYNQGKLNPGTQRECTLEGAVNPYKEEDFEQGIDGFITWCEDNGGSHTYVAPNGTDTEKTLCEFTLQADPRISLQEWCTSNNGTFVPTNEGGQCNIDGVADPLTQNYYNNDIKGFRDWCGKNNGEYKYDQSQDKATCAIYTLNSDQANLFDQWCRGYNGVLSDGVAGKQCSLPGHRYSLSMIAFYEFPSGFQSWCEQNAGASNQSTEGDAVCTIGQKTPVDDFTEWCHTNNGAVRLSADNKKSCVFDNVPAALEEERYNKSDAGEFIFWCKDQNNGTTTRSTTGDVTSVVCNISTTANADYTIKEFCDENGGIYADSNNTCQIRYTSEIYSSKYHDRAESGFRDWCRVTGGEVRMKLGEESLICEIPTNTGIGLRDWCFNNSGNYFHSNSNPSCSLSSYGIYSPLFGSQYSRGLEGYIEWCTVAKGKSRVVPGGQSVECVFTVEELSTKSHFQIWCDNNNGNIVNGSFNGVPSYVCNVSGANTGWSEVSFNTGESGFREWCNSNAGTISSTDGRIFTCDIKGNSYEYDVFRTTGEGQEGGLEQVTRVYVYDIPNDIIIKPEYNPVRDQTGSEIQSYVYNIIEDPKVEDFVLPDPGTVDDGTELKNFEYQGIEGLGGYEEFTRSYVYPEPGNNEVEQGRRAYYTDQEGVPPQWVAYDDVYRDEIPGDNDIKITNESKYRIELWGSSDGRSWSSIWVLNNKDGVDDPTDNRKGHSKSTIVSTQIGGARYIRYSAANAKTFGESQVNYEPRGKAVDITFEVSNISQQPESGRRLYYQPDFVTEPDWNQYDNVYTDILDEDGIGLSIIKEGDPTKDPMVGVWVSNDLMTWVQYGTLGTFKKRFSLTDPETKPTVDVWNEWFTMNGDNTITSVEVDDKIFINRNDDSGFLSYKYVRYGWINTPGPGKPKSDFGRTGLMDPTITVARTTVNLPRQKMYVPSYHSPGRTQSPEVRYYDKVSAAAKKLHTILPGRGIEFRNLQGVDVDIFVTDVDSYDMPNTETYHTKFIKTMKATGADANYIFYPEAHLISGKLPKSILFTTPGKYREDKYKPNGKYITIRGKGVNNEDLTWGVWYDPTEKQTDEFGRPAPNIPRWSDYDFVNNINKDDGNKISFENNSMYTVGIWGASEEDFYMNRWTLVGEMKGLGSSDQERTTVVDRTGIQYLRYACHDAWSKFRQEEYTFHYTTLKNSPNDFTSYEKKNPMGGSGVIIDVTHTVSASDKEDERRMYWAQSPSVAPTWSAYDRIKEDKLEDNKLYTITNNTKYQIEVLGRRDDPNSSSKTNYFTMTTIKSGSDNTGIIRGDQADLITYSASDANSKFKENQSEYLPLGKVAAITLEEDDLPDRKMYYQSGPEVCPTWSRYTSVWTDDLVNERKYTLTNQNGTYDIDVWGCPRGENFEVQANWKFVGTVEKMSKRLTFESNRWSKIRYGSRLANSKGEVEAAYQPIGKQIQIVIDSVPLGDSKSGYCYWQSTNGSEPDYKAADNTHFDSMHKTEKRTYTFENKDTTYDIDVWGTADDVIGPTSKWERIGQTRKVGSSAGSQKTSWDSIGYKHVFYGAANAQRELNISKADFPVNGERFVYNLTHEPTPGKIYHQMSSTTPPYWEEYSGLTFYRVDLSDLTKKYTVINRSKYGIQVYGSQTKDFTALTKLGTCKKFENGREDHKLVLQQGLDSIKYIIYGAMDAFTTYREAIDEYKPFGKNADIKFTVEEVADASQLKTYWTDDQLKRPNWDKYAKPIYMDGPEGGSAMSKNHYYEIINHETYPVRLWLMQNGWTNPDANNTVAREAWAILPGATIQVKGVDNTRINYAAYDTRRPESDWLNQGKNARMTFRRKTTPEPQFRMLRQNDPVGRPMNTANYPVYQVTKNNVYRITNNHQTNGFQVHLVGTTDRFTNATEIKQTVNVPARQTVEFVASEVGMVIGIYGTNWDENNWPVEGHLFPAEMVDLGEYVPPNDLVAYWTDYQERIQVPTDERNPAELDIPIRLYDLWEAHDGRKPTFKYFTVKNNNSYPVRLWMTKTNDPNYFDGDQVYKTDISSSLGIDKVDAIPVGAVAPGHETICEYSNSRYMLIHAHALHETDDNNKAELFYPGGRITDLEIRPVQDNRDKSLSRWFPVERAKQKIFPYNTENLIENFNVYKWKVDPGKDFNSVVYNYYQTFLGLAGGCQPGVDGSIFDEIRENNEVREDTLTIRNPLPYDLELRVVQYSLPKENKREKKPFLVRENVVMTIPKNGGRKTFKTSDVVSPTKWDKRNDIQENKIPVDYQDNKTSLSLYFAGVVGNTWRNKNFEGDYRSPYEGMTFEVDVTRTYKEPAKGYCYWSQNERTMPPVDVWWSTIHRFDMDKLVGDNDRVYEFANNRRISNEYKDYDLALWWADERPAGFPEDIEIEEGPNGTSQKHFLTWKYHGDKVKIGEKITMSARAKYLLLAAYDSKESLNDPSWDKVNGEGKPVDFDITPVPENDRRKGTIYLNNNNTLNRQPRWVVYNHPLKYTTLSAGNNYKVKNLSDYKVQLWITKSVNATTKVPNGDIQRSVSINPGESKNIKVNYKYVFVGAFDTETIRENEWGLDGRSGDIEFTQLVGDNDRPDRPDGSTGATGIGGSTGIGGGGTGIGGSTGRPDKPGSSGILDKLWDFIFGGTGGLPGKPGGGKPGKPGGGKLLKKLFKYIAEILGPAFGEILVIVGAVIAVISIFTSIADGIEANARDLDIICETKWKHEGNEVRYGGKRLDDWEPGNNTGLLPNIPGQGGLLPNTPGGIGGGTGAWERWLERWLENKVDEIDMPEAIEEIKDKVNNEESELGYFTYWPKRDPKFINVTIGPIFSAVTRLLRCRHNGFAMDLRAHKTGIGQDKVKVMRVMNFAPTYSFGYTQLRDNNFYKVLRDYNPNTPTPPTIHEETRVLLDSRYDHIEYQDFWKPEDMWFQPCIHWSPKNHHQEGYESKGGAVHYMGKQGMDVQGGGTQLGAWVNGATHNDKLDRGAYMMNIFNREGTGAKYNSFYTNNNTGDYKGFGYEILAGEPKPWLYYNPRDPETYRAIGDGLLIGNIINNKPGGPEEDMSYLEDELYPGIEFDLVSIDLETDSQIIKQQAFRDWQMNYIHLSFENLKTGELKSIEVYPQEGSLNSQYYQFRRSWNKGDPPTQKMDQLPNGGDFLKLRCTPDKVAKNRITKDWAFWGFIASAWIGRKGGEARWRCFNIANLKPITEVYVPK